MPGSSACRNSRVPVGSSYLKPHRPAIWCDGDGEGKERTTSLLLRHKPDKRLKGIGRESESISIRSLAALLGLPPEQFRCQCEMSASLVHRNRIHHADEGRFHWVLLSVARDAFHNSNAYARKRART